MEELYLFNILQLTATVRLMAFQTHVYFFTWPVTHACDKYLPGTIYIPGVWSVIS